MSRAKTLTALIGLSWLLPAAVAADSRFDLPRIAVEEASPERAEARIVDQRSGRDEVLRVGERYADRYRLVEVDAERIVLRRAGAETVYYVLPVRRKKAPSSADSAPDLGPIDPYVDSGGDARELRRVIAPKRSRAARGSGEPKRRTTQPLNPYGETAPAGGESDPSAPIDPYRQPPPEEGRGDESSPPRSRPAAHADDGQDRDGGELRRLSRSELDESLADIRALEKTVTLRPRRDGVRIETLEPGSFMHRLGLREGDVVRSVAGRSLDSVEAAAALYAHLARTDEFAVHILRSGRAKVLRYRLVP